MDSLTHQQLKELIQQISLQYFDQPFVHEVKINRRMTTTGGRYHLDDHHLEINAHFLTPDHYDDLVGIIKHELCHYHLHLNGLGYQHRDRDFRNLLKQVGGSRYAPDIGLKRPKKYKYLYRCTNCGLKYPRVRRIKTQKYRCGQCRGRLQLVQLFK